MKHIPDRLFGPVQGLVLILMLVSAVWAQTAQPANNAGQSTETTPSDTVTASINGQAPFLGSVPTGKPTGTIIPLSITDAIEQGLKYNLGLIESIVGTRTSRAERLRALSKLLPNINTSFSQEIQQIDLQAMGINFPGVPTLVGPFGVQDARGYLPHVGAHLKT